MEVIAMKWLPPEEVETLTGYKQLQKQVAALRLILKVVIDG